MIEHNLRNRVAIVTGAGGSLGRRIVERFVREGAKVAAVVRRDDAAHQVTFPGHENGRVFIADVTDEGSVATCFREIGEAFGRVDVLVHTVGTWSGKPFPDTSLAEWEAMLRTNLTSAFLCFREALRLMDGRSGRLIGFASAQGADGGRPQQSAYSASKAGLIRLVEAVAAELEGTAISAHAIAPSTILYGEIAGEDGVSAEDLADLCIFLCSEAGPALNGKTLRAYGREARG